MAESYRICFVCVANVIRSPLAQNLFRQITEQKGVAEKYEVDSAALTDWHIGESPDMRMRLIAARHGLNYTHTARQFKRSDFSNFDLILIMEPKNREELVYLRPDAQNLKKIHLIREFDPLGGVREPVPDPVHGDASSFEEVYQIIERSCRGLLIQLERRG